MSSSDEAWIQHLFVFHSIFAVVSGAIAVLYPSFWHVFFTFDDKGQHRELLDTAIQLYGALIFGQSILVYTFRSQLFTPRGGQPSAFTRQLRQGVCLAYTIVFALSFCFVVKAQIMGVMNVAANVNSVLFLGLAGAYGVLLFRSTSGAPKRLAL